MKEERVIIVCPKCRQIHILERVGHSDWFESKDSVKITGYEEYIFTCRNRQCEFEFLVPFEPEENEQHFVDYVLKRGLEMKLWAVDRWVLGGQVLDAQHTVAISLFIV